MLEKELCQRINILNQFKLQIIQTTKIILEIQNSCLNKINEFIIYYKSILNSKEFENSEYHQIVEIITSEMTIRDLKSKRLIKRARKMYSEDILIFKVDENKEKLFKDNKSLDSYNTESIEITSLNAEMSGIKKSLQSTENILNLNGGKKNISSSEKNPRINDRSNLDIIKSFIKPIARFFKFNSNEKESLQDISLDVSSIIHLQSFLRGYIERKKNHQNISKPLLSKLQILQSPIIPDYSTPITRMIKEKLGPFIYHEPSQSGLQSLGPVLMENKAIYTGEWDTNKLPCGKGVQEWTDGAYYEGYWENGKANGKGRFIHANGDVYEGDWKDDKANGRGVHIHADGSKYEGTWKNDKPHGQGVEVWPDGGKYNGDYLDGQKSGKGIFEWSDGSWYNGEFLSNAIHGFGSHSWNDGRKYVGEWRNDQMNGKGIFTWADGRRYEGEYLNDKKKGFGIFWWPDGRKYSGLWLDGKQNGPGTYTKSNGVDIEGIWGNGKLIRNKWFNLL